MNKISLTGVVCGKNFYDRSDKDAVINILVTDYEQKKKPSFKVTQWGKTAETLNNEIEKGDTVRISGYVSGIEQNLNGDLIVISGKEVSCASWKTILDAEGD